MNPLSIVVIPYNRIRHLVAEPKGVRERERAIETVRENHKYAKNKRMEHYERIYNVGLYVLILDYDFFILKNDALFSVRRWKKKFVARQMAVQLYEASQDLPRLLGKEFRVSLCEIGVSENELEELNSISKRLNMFKDDRRVLLQKIRNCTSAHREKDAALQLQVIEEIELLGIMELAGDFYQPLRDLVEYTTKIVLKMGELKVMIRHIKFEN